MLKTEVLEIKKQFSKDSNIIRKICGCFVDEEKEIQLISKESFYRLPEEDAFKYEEIFRKTLSGTPGKNLLNLEFPLASENEGGAQHFLYSLLSSELEDDALLEQFYQRVIESFEHLGNYYIILIDLAYDVPGRTKDHQELSDASEEVYHAILCSICPVKLSKAGLKYDPVVGRVENAIRSLMVDMPEAGFLFPAFNDRSSDIHSLLYFSKKADKLSEGFIGGMFELIPPIAAPAQKQIIQESFVQAMGEDLDYLAVADLHEAILTKIAQNSDNPEPLILDKKEMVKLLADSGATEEAIEAYERDEDNDISVMAENIVDKKKFEVKTAGISIKADAEHMHLIQTKMVGGVKCIVINIEDNIEVNGIQVKS